MTDVQVGPDTRFWDCPHHDYDESYDAESGEETQHLSCELGMGEQVTDAHRCGECPFRDEPIWLVMP